MDEKDSEPPVNYNKYETGKNLKEGEHQENIMIDPEKASAS